MFLLKQSTTTTVQIGPFVDAADGYTAEEGLTIEDTDVYLSKNGAAFANPNDTNDAAHDTDGWYRKQLDGTDTGTLGRLIVMVNEGGARPVYKEFMVVPANEFDSLVSGTDALDVEVASMAAGVVTAAAVATGAVDADAIAADGAQEIADAVLVRGVSNVEDTADATSLGALVLAAFESKIASGTWTIYKTNHSDTFTTRTVTTDASANPITEVT